VAAVRRTARERGGPLPSIDGADALPDERLVDRVAGDPRKFRTLTADEVPKIMAHECRDRHAYALALCGLRRGEISCLRWEHVNLTDKPSGDGERCSTASRSSGSG
jgi:integrase